MTTKNEIESVRTDVQAQTPDDILNLAVTGQISSDQIDQMTKLMELKERFDASAAKKAYHSDMSKFKLNAPLVTKDKDNAQYKSKYTSLGNLVNTINPCLSEYGFSASWNIEQNGVIKVTCKVTHRLGHSEIASASADKDKSGAKNDIQQIKSAITYLKAVTFESILGLASTDANFDDDANQFNAEYINEQELSVILDYVARLEVDTKKLLKAYKANTIEEIRKKDYKDIIELMKKKEALKAVKK